MDDLTLFDLLTIIKDNSPLFLISKPDEPRKLMTFREVATDNDLLSCDVAKMRTTSIEGNTTYCLNLRG